MFSKGTKTVLISWMVLLAVLLSAYILFYLSIRETVVDFAISTAEGKMITIADNAILDYFSENAVSYDKISNVSRDNDNNIKGIELDSKLITLIKGKISRRISSEISTDDFVKVGIPLGTLISNDYLFGIGPKIYFTTQFYEGYKIDFINTFEDCGINQVRHSIIMKITLSGTVVSLGKKRTFLTDTSYPVAETIIVGTVPNTYTDFSGGTISSITKK